MSGLVQIAFSVNPLPEDVPNEYASIEVTMFRRPRGPLKGNLQIVLDTITIVIGNSDIEPSL